MAHVTLRRRLKTREVVDEPAIVVSLRDWGRLKEMVKGLPAAGSAKRDWGFCLLGISCESLLGVVTNAFGPGTVSVAPTLVLGVLFAVAGIIGREFVLSGRGQMEQLRRTKQDILREMRALASDRRRRLAAGRDPVGGEVLPHRHPGEGA
jgi:hypothetical protein